MIRNYMPEQHRQFFAGQQLLYIGSQDRQGRVWASVLSGPAGFVSSPDATHLHIDASRIHTAGGGWGGGSGGGGGAGGGV